MKWTTMKTTSRSFRMGTHSTLKRFNCLFALQCCSAPQLLGLFWCQSWGNNSMLWLKRLLARSFWVENGLVQLSRTCQWEDESWILRLIFFLLAFKEWISCSMNWFKRVGIFYLWGQTCCGTTIWLPTTTLKTSSRGVMLNVIKDLSVSSSSPISFEVKWRSSRSDKWYQSQGHGFKLREYHCEGGIIGGSQFDSLQSL